MIIAFGVKLNTPVSPLASIGVVLVVLLVIAAGHLLSQRRYRNHMKARQAAVEGRALVRAFQSLRADTTRERSALLEVSNLLRDPGWAGWQGPYFAFGGSRTPGSDPWGKPFRFSERSNAIYVTSAGADQKFDTADDIEAR